MATPLHFLDILNICDNFRPPDARSAEPLIPFLLTPTSKPPLGLLRPAVLAELSKRQEFTIHSASDSSPRGYASFAAHIATPEARTDAIGTILESWKAAGLFADVMGPEKWRAELYAVYAQPFGPIGAASANYAFAMERSACALFGVVTYGVHMTVYEEDDTGAMQIWVPRRSATKQTWPGYLDNSVAGGIDAGHSPLQTIVKEATEEASLSADLVRTRARATGCVSYFFATRDGWLQPEVEYVYDLRLRPGEIEGGLRPGDTEVEAFQLMPLDEVVAHVRAGEFKPNCAIVLLDFLIRHGQITAENEAHYIEIVTRMHGRFDIERW
ncbi:hypothetical protein BV25DRAFT_1828313 [Artomyces pyxidatus]|uniref:Uncharacterized protein n=1 Tax=Artomyces pyxidatus TaxID=48021 RepID=A0ACB8SVH2_9AGAM|nr:hypothetical protein BV25DRAFT_1828313 [Artomyces pyxidatus]